jgi:tripartite-type tricarboxylate transporter receptor subunit TctC
VIAGPAGGALDALSRIAGERLAVRLRQPFVADFRPGASGMLAAEHVLRSAADGYTLLVAPNGIATEVPHMFKLQFDPLGELQPIAELGRSTLVMVGNRGVRAGGLGELVAEVKAKPGVYSFASYGHGTLSHVGGLILNRIAGLDLLHVGYRGSPPAMVDVLGGQVPLMFDAVIHAAPLVRSGRVKAFAVTAERRSHFLPGVPTFTELGYPQLSFSGWIGVFGQRELPPQLAAPINAEVLQALAAPETTARLVQLYVDAPLASSPQALAGELRADHARNAQLYQAFNLRAAASY